MPEFVRRWWDAVWQWVFNSFGYQPDPDIKAWLEAGAAFAGVVGFVVIGYQLHDFILVKPRQRREQRERDKRDADRDDKLSDLQAKVDRLVGLLTAQAAGPVSAEQVRETAQRIETRAEERATSLDPAERDAAALLVKGDLAGYELALGAILDDSRKVGTAASRKAAAAARDLADLYRFKDVQKRMDLLTEAARQEPEHLDTWAELGRAAIDAGRLDDARTAFEAGLQLAQRSGRTRDQARFRDGIGRLLVTEGNLADALDAYKAAHGLMDSLAKVDPSHRDLQHDLSVSYERIGAVLVAQGNLPEALKAFNASLAIRDRLAKADPGNAGWQRDLSVSQEKIGDVLSEQGSLPEALTAFQASLAIRERLAKADPGNAGWQRDLAIRLGRVATVEGQREESQTALALYRQGRDIIERLRGASPGNATLPSDLKWFEAQIAALEGR